MSTSVPTTRLRIDKSRPFSTIHGERAPGDAHQFAHFQQDGIHFDAQGLHLDNLIDDEKIRALVDRRMKRQMKVATKEAGEEVAGDTDTDNGDSASGSDGDTQGDVNIEAWLRGDAKYPWFAITKTVRDRYHQNITRQVDMLEFLVFDEKVVTEAELAPDLKAQLRNRT